MTITSKDIVDVMREMGTLLAAIGAIIAVWKAHKEQKARAIITEQKVVEVKELTAKTNADMSKKIDNIKELVNGSHHVALEGKAIAERGEKIALAGTASALQIAAKALEEIAKMRGTDEDWERAKTVEREAEVATEVYEEHVHGKPDTKPATPETES